MEPLPRLILIGSWALFVTVWIVMAFGAKADVRSQSIDEREPYSIPFVASVVCLLIALHAPLGPDDGIRALFVRLVPLSSPLQWASALTALAGLAVALWARLSLGRNWSARVALKDEHELITSGPYAAIRHPIYTALLLLIIGYVLANRTAFAIIGLALMMLSCWIKLRGEEEMMTQAFPEAYRPI